MVRDQGVWHTPPADPGSRGRGLQLIGVLAGDAEIRPSAEGTTVTLRSHLDPASRPPPHDDSGDGQHRGRPGSVPRTPVGRAVARWCGGASR